VNPLAPEECRMGSWLGVNQKIAAGDAGLEWKTVALNAF